MVYFKRCSMRDVTEKYGFNNMGIFSDESIKKEKVIWRCELNNCDYLRSRKFKLGSRKVELDAIIEKDSRLKEFIERYADMTDDDVHVLPSFDLVYNKNMSLCECALFNHSCEPNVGFKMGSSNSFQALRDIKENEELTVDYQFQFTETGFVKINNCKCGQGTCRGVLLYDQYRNADWQKKYYKYASKR